MSDVLKRKYILSTCENKTTALPLLIQNDLTDPLQCAPITQDFNDFKNAIVETAKKNIALLKELPAPKTIPIEQVITFFESEIKRDLEKDRLFEKSVEIRKYARTMFESVERYFRNIFDFHKGLKDELASEMVYVSKIFLNSDLPELFVKTLSRSQLIEVDYIDLFDQKIRKERLNLVANRNNRTKFERVCTTHNAWVRSFCEKLEVIQKEKVKLMWYIDLNNSNSAEKIFKPKFIATKKLDEAIFLELIQKLESASLDLEALVIANIENPCLPEIDVDESIKTITAMMEILNQ